MRVILILLLMCSTAFAGDYVCHSGGTITKSLRSVDGSTLGSECLQITRSKLEEITRFHKVDVAIIGSNDDKVVEMSQLEKDAIIQAEADALIQSEISAVDNFNVSVEELGRALVQLGIVDGVALKDKIKEIKGLN